MKQIRLRSIHLILNWPSILTYESLSASKLVKVTK